MKLIDKDKLLDRLEELRQNLSMSPIVVIEDIKSLVESLEVKEVQEEPVSNDLEEAIKKYLKSLRKSHFEGYDIERAFKKGAQWQKTKAYKWLKEHKEHPLIGCEDPCLSGYLTDEFIEEFKKAMEE